jgi:HlyD family secretion protein
MFTKWMLPLLGALALGFAIYSTQRMTPVTIHAAPPSAPPAAAYAAQLGAVGLVEAASENIAVSLPVPGLVTQVDVKAGDRVQKAQLLFSLDSRDLAAELKLRQSSLELAQSRLRRLEAAPRTEEIPNLNARVTEAKAQLEDAQMQMHLMDLVKDKRAIKTEEYERRKRAVDSAQARLEQADASLRLLKAGTWKPDLDVARLEVKQAQAQVERIRADIDRLEVRAPISGVILQCKVRPGEYAQSGVLAQPLILMGDTEHLNVRAQIDEKDAWRFKPGAAAKASVATPNSITPSHSFVTSPTSFPRGT